MDFHDKKQRVRHIFSARKEKESVSKILDEKLYLDHQGFLTDSGKKKLNDLLSIYRDKREETFRYIIIDEKKIVDHLAVCSHLLNSTDVSLKDKKNNPDDFSLSIFFKSIRSYIIENDYSVILAHNHPSGNVKPSSNDIFITSKIELSLAELGSRNRFLGHIIFDHNKYSFYDPTLGNAFYDFEKWDENKMPFTTEHDPLLKKHIKPYFNVQIDKMEKISYFYKIIKESSLKEDWDLKNHTPFFTLNNDYYPVAVKFIENDEVVKASLDDKCFNSLKKDLTAFTNRFAGVGVIPAGLQDKTIYALDKLARKDIFIDAIINDRDGPRSWGASFPGTNNHFPCYLHTAKEEKIPTFERSKNFKASLQSKKIDKDCLFSPVER